MQQKKQQREWVDVVRIALFVVLIFVPFIATQLGVGLNSATTENRKLNKKPSLSAKNIKTYAGEYQNYFNDSFAFRAPLVRLQNYVQVALLKSSPRQDVIVGKNDWLFYNVEGPLQQERLFTQQDLILVRDRLETMSSLLTNQGISFYVFITPNAQTIYSEHLPNTAPTDKSSRLTQVVEYLKQTASSVHFVDPRRALLDGKALYPEYRRYDTHWNDYGAFVAYQKLFSIISQSYPVLQPKPLQEFRVVSKRTANTDLLGMLGLNGYKTETAPTLEPITGHTATQIIVSCRFKPNCEEIRTTKNDQSLPRLLMYRDSFSNHLLPFIGEHFSDALYVWRHQMREEDLRRQSPNIVIYQIVERDISELRNLELKID